MSAAIPAKGTLLMVGSTPIAEIIGLQGPSMKLDTVDVTNHQSLSGWKECIPTLKHGGEVSFEINFIPTNATHRNIVGGLIYLFDQGILQPFTLVWPDTAGTSWAFSSYVTGFTPAAPHDGKLSAAVTLKVSGPVSFDLGSYTYYVDPVNGNDANDGTSPATAWKTTAPADAVTLTGTESVGYLYAGYWVLYRKIGMTTDETTLPTDLLTATTDKF